MADATTHYSVVTTYRVVDLSDGPLKRYADTTRRAGAGTRGFLGDLARLGGSSRYAAAAMGPLAVGVAVATAGVVIAARTFRSLSQAMDATNQLAPQINLASKFSPDRIENFNRSLGASRVLVQGLARDAAKLPGDFADFRDIAKAISIPTLRAGGSLADVRALTGRLALAGPALGQSPSAIAGQAQQLLLGSRVSGNPLFAMLGGPGSALGDAKTFKAMALPERLRTVNREFERLADNPIFRRNAIRGWNTQLGNLSDNLFGSQGIFGQLLADPFHRFYSSLTGVLAGVNAGLDRFERSGFYQTLKYVISPAGPSTGLDAFQRDEYQNSRLFVDRTGGTGPDSELNRIQRWRKQDSIGRQINDRALEIYKQVLQETGMWNTTLPLAMQSDLRASAKLQATGELADRMFLARQSEKDQNQKFTIPKTNITQHFSIKLDLKSDDSPDAVAVKITKALAKVGKHPQTAARALGAVPSP